MQPESADCGESPSVSVIILGYNGYQWLGPCLESVLDQDLAESYEVIYADNGSTDGSLDYVRTEFKQVQAIDLERNWGYAVGNNRAASYAQGRYLLFLNQDTILHRKCLGSLLYAMLRNPAWGACHANMIMPWQADFTLDLIHCPRLVHVAEINQYGFAEYRTLPMCSAPIETRLLSGACFMLDRRVMQRLPYLFDPSFYMYAEDLDLALRVAALGYRIALIPAAVVYHNQAEPKWLSVRTVSRAYRATRNRILAFYKITPPAEFRRFLPRLIVGAPLKVFEVRHNRLMQGLALIIMLPITLVATFEALLHIRLRYGAERQYWLKQRTDRILGR